MKFIALPEEQFWVEYNKGFEMVEVPTEEDKERLRYRISCLQQALVDQLSSTFEEYDEFAIGWDYDYRYFVCGGVYGDATVSPKLLEGIGRALATDPEPNVWTFHAAVEAPSIDGQFFVRNGEVVFPENGPDFSSLLQKSSLA
jgi:hypothetical protein